MKAQDDQLVRATLSGELHAFEVLVERHRDVVQRLAARIVGEDEAEDVTQDAFLRAYHRLDRWRGDGSFRTWLLHIAFNSALDSAGSRRARSLPLEETVLEVAEAEEHPRGEAREPGAAAPPGHQAQGPATGSPGRARPA